MPKTGFQVRPPGHSALTGIATEAVVPHAFEALAWQLLDPNRVPDPNTTDDPPDGGTKPKVPLLAPLQFRVTVLPVPDVPQLAM